MQLHSDRVRDGSEGANLFHQSQSLRQSPTKMDPGQRTSSEVLKGRADVVRGLTSAVSIRSDFLSNESIALTTSVTVSANALKLTSIGAAGGDLPRALSDAAGAEVGNDGATRPK